VPLLKWPPAAACCCCGSGHVSFDVLRFVHKFPFNPHFNIELDYIIRGQSYTEFSNIFRVGKYCQLFTHESIIHQYVSVSVCCLYKVLDENAKNARNHARNSPFPLRHVDFHLTHECLAHPTYHAKRQLDRCTHFHTTTQQSPLWLQWDAANSPPKLPLRLRRSPLKSNTPIPSQTPLTTPNGIQIQSAVLPLITCADGQMGLTNVPLYRERRANNAGN